ncbi:MAG: cobalt transporter subunit cbtB-like protein [Marinosulfonomonas sp.]|nr:MAG: cobalt transporter subunit cbtB-like protein [Marinosulfonomonas sp.]
MTVLTRTQTSTETDTGLMPIVGAFAAGVFLIFFAGFAQATVFHDSAHDTRHTLAFPCH